MNSEERLLALEQSRESLILERDKKIAAIDDRYASAIKGIEDAIRILRKSKSSSTLEYVESKEPTQRIKHINIAIKDKLPKSATIKDVSNLVGAPFPEDHDLRRQIFWALINAGRAIRKSLVDDIIKRQHGGAEIETRHTLRKMKEHHQIYSVSLNGSKRYSYLALPRWIADTEKGKVLLQEYAPIEDGETTNVELLKIENGYEEMKTESS